jgi:hypothetical protein
MTTQLTKTIINCTTGETIIVALTPEELADRETLIQQSAASVNSGD